MIRTLERTEGLTRALAAAALSVGAGSLVAGSPDAAFAFCMLVLAAIAFVAVPASGWALAAAVAAVTFRGLSGIGLLPGMATYLDIPLAWGALAVALPSSHNRERGPAVPRWLGYLVVVILASAVLNGTELLRPAFYLALLGQPFAIIGALLLQPPTQRMRVALSRTVAGLIALQVPLVLFQFSRYGAGDDVQGTLYGSQAGAHLAAAICTLGLFWWLGYRKPLSMRSLPVSALLLAIPFLASAKQVVFALPAAVLMRSHATSRRRLAVMTVLVGATVAILVMTESLSTYSNVSIQRTAAGNTEKVDRAREVLTQMREDFPTLTLGQGPANTVSRAAFLTTDPIRKEDSPVRILELEPSRTALEDAQENASSFESGRSSAIGVLGDIGVLGFLAYSILFGSVLFAVRKRKSSTATAATSGMLILGFLGLVADWWEQGPFTVLVAILAALALTDPSPEGANAREQRI
jgi:hypothetical protein